MAARGARKTVLALAVRVPSLLERLRQNGFRAELRGMGRRALRQVVGRYPRLIEWIGTVAAVQRQAMASSGVGPRVVDTVFEPGIQAPSEAPRSTATLIDVLVHNPSWERRVWATRALASAGTPDAVDPLIAALRDPSAEVAMAVVVALAKWPDAGVTAAFVGVLRNVDGFFNPMTQAAVIARLAGREGDDAIAVWSDAVHAVDAELSVAAIAAIVEHKRSQALSLLRPVVEDTSGYFLPMVRVTAATALVGAGLLTHAECGHLLQNETDLGVRSILATVVTPALDAGTAA